MDEVQVGVVRRFNRTVTQRVGALNDSFLSRGRPLGHSRVLWEIGDGAELRELRARLDLDSGYLSRILRSLETDGLATVSTDGDDRRVRRVALTPAGLRERAALDELSDAQASAMLHPLGDRQRVELAGAMATVSRLLEASAITVAIAAPASPAVRTSMAAYFDELARRFEAGFDPSPCRPPTSSSGCPRGWCCSPPSTIDPSAVSASSCTPAVWVRSSGCGCRARFEGSGWLDGCSAASKPRDRAGASTA